MLRRPILIASVLSRPRILRYYVGAGGNDNNTGLSWGQRWLTLAKVEAFSFSLGNNVLLDGTFNESLTLDPAKHNGIRLGIVGDGAMIDGEDLRATGIQARYVTGLTIENLTVKRSTVTNIEFGETGVNTVSGVTVEASGDQNFAMSGTCQITLRNCLSKDAADDGLSMHNGARVWVYNTAFTGNSQAINTSTDGSPTLLVDGCTFTGNVNNNLALDFGGQAEVILRRSWFSHCTGGNNNCSVEGGALVEYCVWDVYGGINSARIIGTTGGIINMRNCSIIGNNTGDMLIFTGDTYNLTNCICYDLFRMSNANGGAFNVDYSDLYSVATKALTAETNIINSNGDPNLVDPANDDFRLQVNLTGTSYAGQLTTDYAGNAVNLANPSIGAFEHVG